MVIKVNSKNFEEEVLKSELPIIVDFSATWCGPCKMISPIVDDISNDLSGKVKVAKIDIDESMDIAIKYNVMSVPTLILFKGGQVIHQVSGAMPKKMLMAAFENHF